MYYTLLAEEAEVWMDKQEEKCVLILYISDKAGLSIREEMN